MITRLIIAIYVIKRKLIEKHWCKIRLSLVHRHLPWPTFGRLLTSAFKKLTLEMSLPSLWKKKYELNNLLRTRNYRYLDTQVMFI